MCKFEKARKPKLVLSPSRVDMFKQCRRRYYNRYIARMPLKQWPHFRLGTFAHGALENFHQYLLDGEKDGAPKLMKRACLSFHRQMEREGRQLLDGDQAKEAHAMLAAYLRQADLEGKQSKVLELEKKFTIRLNNDYDLTGIVDRLDMDADDVYHIKDYKTSKNARYMKPFQLNAYGIWLLEEHPEVERFRGSYIMLRLNSELVSYDFTREDVDKCRQELIKTADDIMSEERWIQNQGKLCNWCDFQEVCFNSWC